MPEAKDQVDERPRYKFTEPVWASNPEHGGILLPADSEQTWDQEPPLSAIPLNAAAQARYDARHKGNTPQKRLSAMGMLDADQRMARVFEEHAAQNAALIQQLGGEIAAALKGFGADIAKALKDAGIAPAPPAPPTGGKPGKD